MIYTTHKNGKPLGDGGSFCFPNITMGPQFGPLCLVNPGVVKPFDPKGVMMIPNGS